MSRAARTIMWIVIIFIGYVIVTRPSIAADAVAAIWQGIVNVANAIATFLDDLIPKS
jgi:hypothetical protein